MEPSCLNLAFCTWLYWVSSHWASLYIPDLPCDFSLLRLLSFSNLMFTCSVPSSQLLNTILKLLMTLTPVQPHINALAEWQRIFVNSREEDFIPYTTFNDCICRIFVYCSYKNLTKTRMNHINPVKSQGWLLCQKKEVGCFSGMHYLQVWAGCFYSLLSSKSMLSVDRSWTDGYVILWVHFFLLLKGKSVVLTLAVLFIRRLEYISCRSSFLSYSSITTLDES